VLVTALPIQGFLNVMIYSGRFRHVQRCFCKKKYRGEVGARSSNSASLSGLSLFTSSQILSIIDPNSNYEHKHNDNPTTDGGMTSDPESLSIDIEHPDDTTQSAALPMAVVNPEAAQ
jgi:hypothetical protein